MKIAFLINSLEGGGAEKVLSLLVNKFIEESNDIYIFTLGNNNSVYQLNSKIKLISLTSCDDHKKTSIRKLLDFIYLPFVFKKQLKKYDISIIKSVMFRSNIIGILTSYLLNIKVFISEHSILTKENQNNQFNSYLIKKFYKKAYKIIAVSNSVRLDLIENYSINQNRIEVIYNPIDIKNIQLKKNESIENDIKDFFKDNFTISYCGRIVEMKNVQLVLKVIYNLSLKSIKINLLIIGDGQTYLNNLKKLCSDYNLNKQVMFLGWQKNPYKYIAKSNLFILPSLWESFGNVVIESYICRTPIVTSNVFALKELSLKHHISKLFQTENEDDLERVLLDVYGEKNDIFDMKLINKFSIENIYLQYKLIILGNS